MAHIEKLAADCMQDVEEEEEEEGLEEDADLLVRLPCCCPRVLGSSLWKRPGFVLLCALMLNEYLALLGPIFLTRQC